METKYLPLALALLFAGGTSLAQAPGVKRRYKRPRKTIRRTPVEARRLGRRLERNQDGKLGLRERKLARERLARRRAPAKERILPGNGPGEKKGENARFKVFLREHPGLVKECRARADLNRDGRISPVERRRFYALLLKRYHEMENGAAREGRSSRGADLNGDGIVSPLERRWAQGKGRRPLRRRRRPGGLNPLRRVKAAGKVLGRMARKGLPGPSPLGGAQRAARAAGRLAGKAAGRVLPGTRRNGRRPLRHRRPPRREVRREFRRGARRGSRRGPRRPVRHRRRR